MKRTILSSLLALSLAPLAATQAADLSYSYIEAGKTWVDADGPDADGWGANGSVALGSQFHLFGGYGSQKIDHSHIDVDVSRLGLGWNRSISDTSDIVVRANWLDIDAGFPFGATDGYEAEVGLRSAWTPNFETYLAGGYIDIDRGSGEVYGKLGAQYRFDPRWGIAATATLSDEANEIFVGPRISF